MRVARMLSVALVALLPLGAWAELGVLQPQRADGKIVQKADAKGRLHPVVERVAEGALFDVLQREAREGFVAELLALDAAAQRQAGYAQTQTTWLYLAEEDGGFARRGFWLQRDGAMQYLDEHYIDAVVDTDSIADGSFEELFAHEMGHVFLRRLLPQLPAGHSRTPHAALAVTDRPTAFDEGFAIHMQGLARKLTRNASLRREDQGLGTNKPFLPNWASHIDRVARNDGMRRNSFVYQALPLPGIAGFAAIDYSDLFDRGRLKNGNAMMASEGVVATVFYRWLVATAQDRASLLASYEPLFGTLVQLNRSTLTPDTPLLPRLLQLYAKAQPEQAAATLRLFVETTYGATVDRRLLLQAESLAAAGRINRREAFVEGLKPARTALAAALEGAGKDPATLEAALSPPLWLFVAVKPVPEKGAADGVALDLNAVDAPALGLLLDDAALAARLVEWRREHGGYADIAAAIAALKLPAKQADPLRRLHAAALKAGTWPRE